MRPLVWFSNTVPYQSQLQYENLQKRAWKIQFSLGHWGLKKEAAAGRNQLWKTLYKMVFALLALADARFILIKCRLYEKRFSLDSLSFLPEDYDKCEAMRKMWKLHRRTQHWIGIDQKQAAKKRRINLVLESKKPSSWEIYSHQHSSWIDNSIVLKSTKPWKIRLITSSNNGNKAWWRA